MVRQNIKNLKLAEGQISAPVLLLLGKQRATGSRALLLNLGKQNNFQF